MTFDQHTIVYVTDRSPEKKFGFEYDDAEGYSQHAVNSMVASLQALCKNLLLFQDIKKFSKKVLEVKNPLVFSTYLGTGRENAKAQVPSICEANGIPYVGASSYVQMLCNDKYLSKSYLERYGLKSAFGVLIANPKDEYEISQLKLIKYPAVVKPNYGGGSNGIMSSSLVNTLDEAERHVRMLYRLNRQPILVEEYMPGYEIEVILTGNQERMILVEEMMLSIDGNTYFNDEIYGLESKKMGLLQDDFIPTHMIDDGHLNCFIKLFQSFQKMEFMRIDCRVRDGVPYIIELSPDCFLAETGAFYAAFKHKGYSHKEMIEALLLNTLD